MTFDIFNEIKTAKLDQKTHMEHLTNELLANNENVIKEIQQELTYYSSQDKKIALII